MSKFAGRTYVVTGGASGIGEATVRAIIAEGGRVVIADLQTEPGEALSKELGAMGQFIQTDVTIEQDIVDAIALAEREPSFSSSVNISF